MRILSFLSLTAFAFFPAVATAGPAAPWAPLAKDAPHMIVTQHRKSPPSADELDAPAYPGAEVITLVTRESGLPYLDLISSDSPQKVIEWYKQNLNKDWKWDKTLKVFYQGNDAMAAIGRKAPMINVISTSRPALSLMGLTDQVKSHAQSRIRIVFRQASGGGGNGG